MWRRVVTLKLTDISEVRTASSFIALMMEAVRISETSANFNVPTPRYIKTLNCMMNVIDEL
jgi:hypothetical protein